MCVTDDVRVYSSPLFVKGRGRVTSFSMDWIFLQNVDCHPLWEATTSALSARPHSPALNM